LLATLDNLSPCTESPCDQGFGAVRSQLSAEFAAVSQVRGFFTGGGSSDLNGVIQHAYTDTSLGFTAITSKILALYNPPPSGTQAFGPLQIINAALSIASGLTGAIPDVGSAISGGFEVTQTILGIIEATSGSGGVSAFDPSQFEGDVYNLGTNLEAAFNQGINRLSHVADLLVSDWGRLQAANAKILTPGTEGGWGLDTTSQGRLTSQLQTNLAAYVWQTLLPVPLTELRCPDNKCAPPPLDNFPLVVPAPNEPDFVQVVSALLLTSTFGPPDQETMNQLFGSGGLGLQPPYFLAPAMTDSKGNRLTPGFSCNQNVPVIEPFKPCD